MNKTQRREASKHEDGVDLISSLQDSILLLILSGLPSTEEVIRTSILSRRWRYLWTSIPSLDLVPHLGLNPKLEKSNFKKFVYWVLLNRSVDLDTFRLSSSDDYSMSTVEQWIRATVMRNVKQLDLSFTLKKSEDMVMPHCVVTCASLEVLSLSCRRVILPSFSGFPALRVLKLEYVELFDDLGKYFLESCPLLEDLTLEDCRVVKLDLLCISCPKLKKLWLLYQYNNGLCGCLKISCPKLVFLKIDGEVASTYIFERLYSLKEAVINPDRWGMSNVFHTISRLFHGVSHVESLETNLNFLSKCIEAGHDLVLPNLKTLELTTTNSDYTVTALIQVLKICPKLESLNLTIKKVPYVFTWEDSDESEDPKSDSDVKWVESFEFNGEKPKVDIDWYENKNDWRYITARWGNKAK